MRATASGIYQIVASGARATHSRFLSVLASLVL
jgi:hypothetical protein